MVEWLANVMSMTAKGKAMAKQDDLARIRQGVKAWNEWMEEELRVNEEEMEALRAQEIENWSDPGFDTSRDWTANTDAIDVSLEDLSLEDTLYVADLSGAELTDLELDGVMLWASDLAGANLTGSSLAYAVLRGSDLTNANLTDVNMTGADLTNARLRGAKLRGATLTSTKIQDADLEGDEAAAGVRPTIDVDAIVEVTSYLEYFDFSERLRNLGFEDQSESPAAHRSLKTADTSSR